MSVNLKPTSLTEFLTGGPIVWLNQNPVGQANAAVLGYMLDSQINLLTQAVQCRFPEISPADALIYIAQERQLIQGPTETTQHFATRLKEAWAAWELGGSPTELLIQLSYQGFDGYLIQQNGLVWKSQFPINEASANFPLDQVSFFDGYTNENIFGSPPYFGMPLRTTDTIPIPRDWRYQLPNDYGVQQNNRFILFCNTAPAAWSGGVPSSDQLNTISSIINTWKSAHSIFEGILVNSGSTCIQGWNCLAGTSVANTGAVSVYLSDIYTAKYTSIPDPFVGWSQDQINWTGTGEQMNGAFAVGVNEAYIVGNNNHNYKWDGSSWSSVSITGVGIPTTAIRGTVSGSTLVAIINNTSVAVSTNHGTSWSTPAGSITSPRAPAVISDAEWYIGAGSGKIYHTTNAGGTFTNVYTSTAATNILSMFALSTSSVWAVTATTAMHWDGATWTEHTLPGSGSFIAIWGTSDTDMYAAGGGTTRACGSSDGFATTTPYTGFSAFTTHAITGLNGDVWFLGQDGNDGTVVYKKTGTGTAAIAPFCLNEPNFVITDAWCGGGKIVASGGAASAIVTNTKASGWFERDIATTDTSTVQDMLILDGDNIWCCNSSFGLLKFDKTLGWQTVNYGVSDSASAIFAFDTSSTMWLGHANTPSRLLSSSDHGVTWTQRLLNGASLPGSPTQLWGASATDIWVVCNNVNVYHSTDSGATFTVYTFGHNVMGVSGIGTNNVWLAATNGTVYHFDGAAWTTIAVTPAGTSTLNRLLVRSATDIIVVGNKLNGVFRTTDGGNTWVQQTMLGTTGTAFNDVRQMDSTHVYVSGSTAVGDGSFKMWLSDLSSTTWAVDPSFVQSQVAGFAVGDTTGMSVSLDGKLMVVGSATGRTWITGTPTRSVLGR